MKTIKDEHINEQVIESGYIQLKEEKITTVVEKGKQIAVQFFPEKNGNYKQPSQFLSAFLDLLKN